MEYEELIQLVQEGKISTLEFVERQEDLQDLWDEWRKNNGREKDDRSARDFLSYMDDYVMSHQDLPDLSFNL